MTHVASRAGSPEAGGVRAPGDGPLRRRSGRGGGLGAGGAAAVLVAVLVGSVLVAVAIGPADLSVTDVWRTVLAHLGRGEPVLPALQDGIVWQLRLPRVLVAAVVGAGLALCGVIMQALMNNPLADPYLLGLSSGASVGAVAVVVVVGVGASVALPLAAFAGAMAALLLTLAIAQASGSLAPSRTILAGLAVSSVCSALASLLIFWHATGDTYREILAWLLGSLAGASWHDVALVTGAVLVIGVPLANTAGLLDAFVFGDRSAAALGIHVTLVRRVLLGATALLTGALVSVAGSIGFVGLILPHAVRAVLGARHRVLLPVSALAGAVFLVWADTLARTVFDPRELPVGIVTAMVGGPAFAILMLRRREVR